MGDVLSRWLIKQPPTTEPKEASFRPKGQNVEEDETDTEEDKLHLWTLTKKKKKKTKKEVSRDSSLQGSFLLNSSSRFRRKSQDLEELLNQLRNSRIGTSSESDTEEEKPHSLTLTKKKEKKGDANIPETWNMVSGSSLWQTGQPPTTVSFRHIGQNVVEDEKWNEPFYLEGVRSEPSSERDTEKKKLHSLTLTEKKKKKEVKDVDEIVVQYDTKLMGESEDAKTSELYGINITHGDHRKQTRPSWCPLTTVEELSIFNAVKHGAPTYLKCLLHSGGNRRRFNVNVRDSWGQTAVYHAVSNNSIECLQVLLKNGGDANIPESFRNMTPLHQAVLCSDYGAVKLLLEYGADQGAKDNAGQTPLDLAYSVGNETVVTLLSSKYKKTKCPGCPDWQPSFSKHWQFSAEFSGTGGTLQGDSSDIVLHIPEAAVTNGTVVVKGAVSTDLDRVHKELGLGHDERIVSPIIEYFTGQDFLFAKPVRISIPHFKPENCYHCSVSVCWFERESTGKFHVRKLKPKVSGRTAGSTEGDNSNGVFFFSEPDRVVVLTDHFSGYFVCTHCKTCSPKLNLRLYGSYCQRQSRNVDLFLLVWDQRLAIKDFLEVIVPEEKKSMYLCSKTLDPPENIKDVKLGACLSVHEKDKWTLKEVDGNPLFPFQQEINLQNYQPSCLKSTEERLDWALQNNPGRAPSWWFECHIDVGYIPLDDQRFLFLSCPKAQKLLVSLKFSGEDASEEVLVDKGPIQCQDSTIGTTTGENGCILHENNFGDHYQEPVNNKIVSKVQEGTHMRHVFDTVVSGICDEVYPMQQVIRGVFLLINNKSFEEARRRGRNLADRHGTEMDSSALAELFQQLGFIVVLKDNCNSKEIQEALRYEFDRRDHSSYDCFACAILSHGSNDVIFGVDGEPLPIQYLKELSAGTRCPSLIYRPKLFFIQACQGSISDHGVNILNGATVVSAEPEGAYALQQRTTGVSSSNHRGQGQTCPSTADTFTAVATVHGYASFRNENQGTWFIQNLVSVFMRKANELHLAELMTETNRRVSNSETPDRRKQQPTWDSTLNRKLYFFPGLIKPRRPKIANGVPNGTI